LVPKQRPKNLPVLLLLHGKGETGNEALALRAWSELYGLVTSYDRLKRAPVARTVKKTLYLTDEHLARLNGELGARPFRGFASLCPVTPNPHESGSAERTLDRYADWIESTLLSAARDKVSVASDPELVSIDGCSLGGYVALEVFIRKPRLFGSLGVVQAAIGKATALRYAERLAKVFEKVGPRPMHIETSTSDPFRPGNERLAARLDELGVKTELRVIPGPHNQEWLREIGTLQMLHWHDRVFSRLSA
jgi:pimeloyl-ACP methyl ester carboxylesterase